MTRAEAICRMQAYAARNGQQVLADKLGCSRTYVYLITKDRRTPGRKVAGALARLLNIPSSAWDNAA